MLDVQNIVNSANDLILKTLTPLERLNQIYLKLSTQCEVTIVSSYREIEETLCLTVYCENTELSATFHLIGDVLSVYY